MRGHLFWIITLSYLVESRSRLSAPNNRTSENLFIDILSKALQTSRAKDVLLLLRDSQLDGQADDILSEIISATTQRISTLYVDANRTESKFLVSSSAMSRDLIVYIHVAERGPDVIEGELIVEDTKRFAHNRARPKILVLMILHRPCHDLVELFRAMWSQKMLDVIVVEYVESNFNRVSTTVHRYNPFIDKHTEEPYSTDVTWFTDDFPDMQGYAFVYAFTRRPPYNDIASTSKGQELKGVNKMLSEVLADKMNFTGVREVIVNGIYFKRLSNGSQYGIVIDVFNGKYDALLVTIPMWGQLKSMQYIVQYTDPIVIENWCFIIPKLPAKQNFTIGTAIRLFLVSFLIIGIYWLCSKLMRFEPDRWQFLKIVGMILTASFPPAPTKLRERLIFLSVLAISASYSSMLFIELTSIGFESDRYVRFDRLQDLLNSNLALMMQENIRNIMKEYNNPFEYYIRASRKRIITVPSTDVCFENLLMHQNVSCFIYEDWARLVAINNIRNGKTIVKTTKLCYLSMLAGIVFSNRSPYVKRINEILLMLSSGGIRDKWYRDYLRNETKETIFETNRNYWDSNNDILYPMIYALVTGYLVSAFVFVGELIWKYFHADLNPFLF